MAKLTVKELEFYRSWIKDAKDEHKLKFLDRIKPEQLVKAYEGMRYGDDTKDQDTVDDIVNENHLFTATNTLVPSLFYQNPVPIIQSDKPEFETSAMILEALAKHYMNEIFKKENQDCVMDAWVSGYACMKEGYQTNFKTLPKARLLQYVTGKTQGKSENNMEETLEYIEKEHPVLERQSPLTTLLDHTQKWGKGKKITFKYDRNLQELIDSKLYSLPTNFIGFFGGKVDDKRNVKLKVTEHWCMIGDNAWKLVLVDDWQEEIYWGKTPYNKLPIDLLRFNNEPDTLYAVSHLYMGARAQEELDYLNTLWKKHIDKVKRLHLVHKEALDPSGTKTLQYGDIDDIVFTNRPVNAGVYQQIMSSPMSKDVYANIESLRQHLKNLLSVSGAKAGESNAEFAVQDKIAALGDQMRTGGMQDSISEFVKSQVRNTLVNVLRFGSPEITIKIAGQPLTIGGEYGLNLREAIKGDLEKDYTFDIDITSATRPDFPVIRKQMNEAIVLLTNPNIEQKLAMEGKRIDTEVLIKDYLNTFDTISNPDKYIKDGAPPIQPGQVPGQGGQGGPIGAEGPSPESQAGAVAPGVPEGGTI